MKRRILGFVLAICLLLPCAFLMSACDDGILDIAYVQFVPESESYKVLYFNTYAYDDDRSQIYMVPEASTSSEDYILKIFFHKHISPETIKEQTTLCVNIEGWSSMDIWINKDYYSESKKVYINGVDITSTAIISTPPTELTLPFGNVWQDGHYFFEEVKLVKGNTSNYINKIEYKEVASDN